MSLMLLVHADGVAHGAVGARRRVVGSVRARDKVLLMHQVMIPVILLPLGIHGECQAKSRLIAVSELFEQEN